MVHRPGCREEVPGIQVGIPEVLEDAAMERVGSGLQNVVRHALAFVHGLGAGRLHLELFDSLHGNAERQVAGIALRPGAGQRQTFDVHLVLISLTAIERTGGWAGRLGAVIIDSAGKAGESRGISGGAAGIHGQRKRIVHPVVHRGAERHIVRLQGGRLGFHGDRLAGRADRQRGIYRDGCQRFHDHVGLRQRFKTGGLDRNRVLAGNEQRKHEKAGLRALSSGFHSGCDISGSDRGAGDGRSRRVSDRSLDGTGSGDLGKSRQTGCD